MINGMTLVMGCLGVHERSENRKRWSVVTL